MGAISTINTNEFEFVANPISEYEWSGEDGWGGGEATGNEIMSNNNSRIVAPPFVCTIIVI